MVDLREIILNKDKVEALRILLGSGVPINTYNGIPTILDEKDKLYKIYLIEDRQLIGRLWLRADKKVTDIIELHILPIYRGLNYSQEILIAVEQQERALKQTTLTAAAFSDNIPSIRALTTAGFKSTVVRLTKEI